MKKKEIIILLNKRQSYHIIAYGIRAMSIVPIVGKYSGPMKGIGILSNGKVSFKAW